MKKFCLIIAFLICNFSLFAQVQPDTIKTIDPYDEIVWEVQTPGQVYDVAYHPNGKYVFALDDKVVQMFNASDGTLVKEMGRGLNFSFTDMDLSKDGKLVATCGYLDKIIIFDVETGQEKIRLYDTLFGFTDYRSVSFSLDGKKLVVTAGKDFYSSGVLLFDVETGKRISAIFNQTLPPKYDDKDFKQYMNAIYSNSGNFIIIATGIRRLVLRVSSDNIKPIDTLIDNGYNSNFDVIYDKICIKIDNNQEFCFLDGFGNLSTFINLQTKIIDDKRSKYLSAGNFHFSQDNKKAILTNGGVELYSLIPFNYKPLYHYKIGAIYSAMSPNDSLIIGGGGQGFRLYKAKWETQTSVNNDPQFTFNIYNAYPNPAYNQLNAKVTSQISGNIKLEILNLNTQVLFSQNRIITEGENNITLPINNIPSGAYILRATLNNSSKQINFIINR